MAKSPKGKKFPAATIGSGVEVVRVASGEKGNAITPTSAAAMLGKLGGQARARNMTPERRAEIASKAAAKRWGSRKIS